MTETIFHLQEIDFEKPGKNTYEVAFHLDGDWGYVLVPLTVINGLAGPGKNIACFGGTHGNEYEGQVSVRRLAHELDPEQMKGRVILVPRLNPPACEHGMRASPLDGGNMNRAFPGDPRGSITFRIAHFVTTHLFPLVDVVIDIHAAGDGMEFALCTSFHDIPDLKQRQEMRKVAALFDPDFILVYTSEMPGGLLSEEAEKQGKITIGGEFGHSSGVWLKGAVHAYEGCRNVLRHYGNLEEPVLPINPDRPEDPLLLQATDLREYIPAPVTGVYEPVLAVGSRVEKDTLVGRLYDFERIEAAPLEIRAPHQGYIIMQPFRAPTRKGATMLVVGTAVEE